MNVYGMFEHIVESPFYSEKFDGEVRVDDFSQVFVDGEYETTLEGPDKDEIVQELYYEWKRAQSFKEINETE